jgi:hypothetical protein
MTTNTSPLDPIAHPPLSPSVQNEAIFQKIRFIGKIGLVLSTTLLVLFLITLLAMLVGVIIDLSDPSKKLFLGSDEGSFNWLIFSTLSVILEFTWCRIFRRFTRKDLLSQKTVKLIMWATILTFMISLVPLDGSYDPSDYYWFDYPLEIFVGTLNALTLLAFGYVLKISLNLKEENDHTV